MARISDPSGRFWRRKTSYAKAKKKDSPEQIIQILYITYIGMRCVRHISGKLTNWSDTDAEMIAALDIEI